MATNSTPSGSTAICTGLATSGNISSDANRLTCIPSATFILSIASLPPR